MIAHAYYNEIDPYVAQWLRNLIEAGHIAPGDVDERSLRDVHPADLLGYTQCHFFAGIGVWSYALRLAGWPDDRPVWTGSCPCQPFSAAGKRKGTNDDRHLWPEFFRLITAHQPVAVFGEQVASKDGLAWLDIVQADLEGKDYAFGAVDLCAAGVGAPHIRQRLFFVADADGGRARAEGLQRSGQHGFESQDGGAACELGHHHHPGPQGRGVPGAVGERERGSECAARAAGAVDGGGMDYSISNRRHSRGHDNRRHDWIISDAAGPTNGFWRPADWLPCIDGADETRVPTVLPGSRGTQSLRGLPGPVNGYWHPADWLPCIDGKARPVEPGTFPLAHGAPARVGRLRAYGNAIISEAARAFIEAYIELRP